MKRCGGKVWVEPKGEGRDKGKDKGKGKGRGCTFKFTLPRYKESGNFIE